MPSRLLTTEYPPSLADKRLCRGFTGEGVCCLYACCLSVNRSVTPLSFPSFGNRTANSHGTPPPWTWEGVGVSEGPARGWSGRVISCGAEGPTAAGQGSSFRPRRRGRPRTQGNLPPSAPPPMEGDGKPQDPIPPLSQGGGPDGENKLLLGGFPLPGMGRLRLSHEGPWCRRIFLFSDGRPNLGLRSAKVRFFLRQMDPPPPLPPKLKRVLLNHFFDEVWGCGVGHSKSLWVPFPPPAPPSNFILYNGPRPPPI